MTYSLGPPLPGLWELTRHPMVCVGEALTTSKAFSPGFQTHHPHFPSRTGQGGWQPTIAVPPTRFSSFQSTLWRSLKRKMLELWDLCLLHQPAGSLESAQPAALRAKAVPLWKLPRGLHFSGKDLAVTSRTCSVLTAQLTKQDRASRHQWTDASLESPDQGAVGPLRA